MLKIYIFLNPRWRPRWRTCYEATVAIATVRNENLIVVMESNELTQSCLNAKA